MLNQVNITGTYAEAIDINKDGKIDAIDFIRLKKYMLGNSESIIQ